MSETLGCSSSLPVCVLHGYSGRWQIGYPIVSVEIVVLSWTYDYVLQILRNTHSSESEVGDKHRG